MNQHRPDSQRRMDVHARRHGCGAAGQARLMVRFVEMLAAEDPSVPERLRRFLAAQDVDAVLDSAPSTWPVHDAALAALPALVRAELHLRRLAAPEAGRLSDRIVKLCEDLIDAARDVEHHALRWPGGILATIANQLVPVLAAYERAGDGLSVEPEPETDEQDLSQPATGLTGLVVPEQGRDTGAGGIDATATWNRACETVRRGANPREVARTLLRTVGADAGWRDLRETATSCGGECWQDATAPGTVLRAALAVENDDRWWTGPADGPLHVSASSLLALVQSHRALMQAAGRLVMAADAHATDAKALADEAANDPAATADEKQARRQHAAETKADIAFALHALHHARGLP